jgi:hypothetical protein
MSTPKLVFGPDDIAEYTLRKVAELRLLLAFECRHCRKFSQPDFLDLVGRHGPNAKIGDLQRKGRCTRCGKRAAEVLIKAPGTPAKRGWWPRPPGLSR